MKFVKIPTRMCVGCGEMKPKQELIRVVKTSEGAIVLDKTGKQNGRGAYICNDVKCLRAAQKKRGFERAFSGAVPQDVFEKLEGEFSDAN